MRKLLFEVRMTYVSVSKMFSVNLNNTPCL